MLGKSGLEIGLLAEKFTILAIFSDDIRMGTYAFSTPHIGTAFPILILSGSRLTFFPSFATFRFLFLENNS